MTLPAEVKDVRNRLLVKFPLPYSAAPDGQKEETFRGWCKRFAEQLEFSFPGQGWGVKSAGEGRPQSKDTIARMQDGRLYIWDLFSGVGTASTGIVDDPIAADITGQTFIPVTGVNHLGAAPPVTPPPVTPPATGDPSLLEVLSAIRTRLEAIDAKVDVIQRNGPPYVTSSTARVFGTTVVVNGTVKK